MTDESFNDSNALIFDDVYYTRSFVLDEFDGEFKLVGVTHPQEVLPGVNVAQCSKHHETPPIEVCTCGFYAYRKVQVNDTYTKYTNHVRAIIKGSGKTIVQENGVRLEKIEIVALASAKKKNREKLDKIFPGVPIYSSDDELFSTTRYKYPIHDVNFDKTLFSFKNPPQKVHFREKPKKIWTEYPRKETPIETRLRLCCEPFALLGTIAFFWTASTMLQVPELAPNAYKGFALLMMFHIFVNLFGSYLNMIRFPPILILLNALTASFIVFSFLEPLHSIVYYGMAGINAVSGLTIFVIYLLNIGRPTSNFTPLPKILIHAKTLDDQRKTSQ